MGKSLARSIGWMMAISTIAACAANRHTVTSGGEVDYYVAPQAPEVLGAREVQMLHEMSDANIIGHLEAVDSIEIAAADTAMRFSKSDTVLSYAKLMHVQHAADLKSVRDVANQTGLVPTTDVMKLKATHMAASLDSLRFASDLTIDRHYVTSQVQLHRHVLAELETLETVARHPALRAHIEGMIPTVEDHLARAHSVAVAKGLERKGAF